VGIPFLSSWQLINYGLYIVLEVIILLHIWPIVNFWFLIVECEKYHQLIWQGKEKKKLQTKMRSYLKYKK